MSAQPLGPGVPSAADAVDGSLDATTLVPSDKVFAADEDDHGGGFYIPTEVFLLVALAILFALAWKPAKSAVLSALDGRADRIRNELEEAQRLREEAQAALASIQRRQREAMQEAEEIIAHARVEATRLRKEAIDDLEAAMERRERLAEQRIAQAEAAAVAEVRNTAIDVAIATAGNLMASGIDAGKHGALIDRSISDLADRLH